MMSFTIPLNQCSFASRNRKISASRAQRGSLLTPLPRRSRGCGHETPRGNSGDLGRTKKRKRRKWFSRKYYASVMRIKEFYEDYIGAAFSGILSNALDKNFGRNH